MSFNAIRLFTIPLERTDIFLSALWISKTLADPYFKMKKSLMKRLPNKCETQIQKYVKKFNKGRSKFTYPKPILLLAPLIEYRNEIDSFLLSGK